MSKLYKVRLLAHAGASRRRAGLEFEKGQARTLELSKEQLEALQNDSYFSVKEADASDSGSQEDTSTKPPTRKELDARATELGLNPKDYRNIEQVTAAIEEAEKAAEEAGSEGDDEEEDLDLTTLSVDDLKVIATELNINTADLNAETEDQTKANLIEAIEAEKAKEE